MIKKKKANHPINTLHFGTSTIVKTHRIIVKIRGLCLLQNRKKRRVTEFPLYIIVTNYKVFVTGCRLYLSYSYLWYRHTSGVTGVVDGLPEFINTYLFTYLFMYLQHSSP